MRAGEAGAFTRLAARRSDDIEALCGTLAARGAAMERPVEWFSFDLARTAGRYSLRRFLVKRDA